MLPADAVPRPPTRICATRSTSSRRRWTARPPPSSRRRHRAARPAAAAPPADRHGHGPGPRQQINWKWVRRGHRTRCWPCLSCCRSSRSRWPTSSSTCPSPATSAPTQVSTILASDGSELAKIVPPEGNRVDVNIDQIPVHVRDAVMAAEDRDFYTNPGFSFTGLRPRVQEQPLRRRPAGRLDDHPAVREERVGRRRAIGHRRLDPQGQGTRHLDQDVAASGRRTQVLQAYLNIIYFGRGAYGISAASKAYFDKPVEQLTVAEGALLAALIQRPSTLDPGGRSRRRRRAVELGARRHGRRSARCRRPTVRRRCSRRRCRRTRPRRRTRRPDPTG